MVKSSLVHCGFQIQTVLLPDTLIVRQFESPNFLPSQV